jgi:hypothetical protein
MKRTRHPLLPRLRSVPPVGFLDAACRDRSGANVVHIKAVLEARRLREEHREDEDETGPIFVPPWDDRWADAWRPLPIRVVNIALVIFGVVTVAIVTARVLDLLIER